LVGWFWINGWFKWLVLLSLSKNKMNYALFLAGCWMNDYLVDLWIVHGCSTLLYCMLSSPWLWHTSLAWLGD
jgi:hypothetical protein